MPTVQFIISGHVQGVGFRRFVLHHAHRLSLRGFVCNLEDGRVECIAQGSTEALIDLEMSLRQGPQHSDVQDVACNDLETEPRKYSTFRIV
jgi:acylphosphatase